MPFEDAILHYVFELKEEQIFCLQRQLWREEQRHAAAYRNLLRKRTLVAPRMADAPRKTKEGATTIRI